MSMQIRFQFELLWIAGGPGGRRAITPAALGCEDVVRRTIEEAIAEPVISSRILNVEAYWHGVTERQHLGRSLCFWLSNSQKHCLMIRMRREHILIQNNMATI